MDRQEMAVEYRNGLRHKISDALPRINPDDLLVSELRELLTLIEPAVARHRGRQGITCALVTQTYAHAARRPLVAALRLYVAALDPEAMTLIELGDLAARLDRILPAVERRVNAHPHPPIP